MSKAAVVIRDLEDSVERAQKKVLEVTKRTHELEIENRKFKIRLGDQLDTDERSL
jgi:citrate lyase beta subunit